MDLHLTPCLFALVSRRGGDRRRSSPLSGWSYLSLVRVTVNTSGITTGALLLVSLVSWTVLPLSTTAMMYFLESPEAEYLKEILLV